MYRAARGAFEQVDPDVLSAGRTIGMSEWKIFWKVQLPIAWPGVISGAVLAFARGLGEFGATAMTVSYTHLDVYKRQTHKPHWNRMIFCYVRFQSKNVINRNMKFFGQSN